MRYPQKIFTILQSRNFVKESHAMPVCLPRFPWQEKVSILWPKGIILSHTFAKILVEQAYHWLVIRDFCKLK